MQAWDRAAAVLETFRLDYPDSDRADEVTRRLAVVYMESGRKGRAASEFRRIAVAGSTTPQLQREALWQAADLYRETGSVGEERAVLEDIVARFPAPVAEAVEARQRLADLAREAGDAGARQRWLEAIVTADAGARSEEHTSNSSHSGESRMPSSA